MKLSCPHCNALAIKKNGSIHNGKQKYECLVCHRQFVENPQNKQIPEETKERIRRSLLERVSLEGVCRIFDVSLTWLLAFMQETFERLPDDLNATIVTNNEEFEIVVLEADELWSYVGNKKKPSTAMASNALKKPPDRGFSCRRSIEGIWASFDG